MTVKKPDGVLQTTTSTGTGDLTLDGTVAGYRTFAQAVTAGEMAWGDEVYYVVQDGTNREWGRATVISSGPTLKRSTGTIIGSTNGGSAISAAGGGVTQIFPAVPDSVKLLTQDRKANGGTIAETGTDNAFTVKQTLGAGLDVTGATALTGTLAVSDTSTDTLVTITRDQTDAPSGDSPTTLQPVITVVDKNGGAEAGPVVDFDRQSASAAAEDVLFYARFKGRSSTGVARVFAAIKAIATTVTNAAEAGRVIIQGMVGGALTDLLTIASNGIATPGRTLQGAGTLNVDALYINDVLQTAQTRQALWCEDTTLSAGGSGTHNADFGTLSYNSITSLSFNTTSDEFSIPVGTFFLMVTAKVVFGTATSVSMRWRNVTDSTTIGFPDGDSLTFASGEIRSFFFDFTLAGTKSLALQFTTDGTATITDIRLHIAKVG